MSEPELQQPTSLFNRITQIFLPVLTILGFLLTGLKKPALGLLFNLASQFFWLYASWQAWKKANQIGIFVTTLVIFVIVLFGVVNYWFIK